MNDRELAQQVAKRDERAFDELIRLYGGLVKAIVSYHMRDIPMWREDCVNDVLFSIWQNIDRYDPSKNSLKNWIGAVAKYRAINYQRKYYRELVTGELNEALADEKDIDSDILKREIEEETMALLSNLKPKDKEIFIRRYILEQPINIIAAQSKKSPSWIYNRISRAKKKLRREYKEKWSDCCEKRI